MMKINFNPIFNLARCFACHFGPNIFQQCLHCQYLITWHSQPTNWNTTMNHTMNKIPFKDSFIGMFKDIEEKLESDNDHFSQTTIISFFQDTSEILTNEESCWDCSSYPEIVAVADYTKAVSLFLGYLSIMESTWKAARFNSSKLLGGNKQKQQVVVEDLWPLLLVLFKELFNYLKMFQIL